MYHNEHLVKLPQVPADELLTMIRGYRQAMLFYQAFATGIFDALQEPKNADTLSRELGYGADRTVFLLDALTSLGLLIKNGDYYVISPVTGTYLIKNSRFYLGDLIRMEYTQEPNQNWELLQPWLNGEFEGHEAHDPMSVFQPSFIHAMAQSTLSNNSFHETISLVSTHPCFSSAQKMLDLGGGHGLYSIALKQIRPDLNAVVFDLPQVREVTCSYARSYHTELGFCPGNFYEDELPSGQDIVLAFDILHPVTPARKAAVFAKVHRALNRGGYLFYKVCFLDETRTNPRKAAIFALKQKIRNSSSHVYTLGEAKHMLNQVGFQIEKTVPSGDKDGTMIIARKVVSI